MKPGAGSEAEMVAGEIGAESAFPAPVMMPSTP